MSARKLFNVFGLLLFLPIFAASQQPQTVTARRLTSIRLSPPPAAQQSDAEEDEDLIKPSRPTIANPAEFQKPGVVQIEYGYDGNFRAD